ncbi:hypothetical protein GTY54_02810 [Streptomyces sp. SID625]|nr:hypothetical protein [Streptomyces sp. SID625]
MLREADAELVRAMWKPAAFTGAELPPDTVDRDVYVVCLLELLSRCP